jgi:hypothetical protein
MNVAEIEGAESDTKAGAGWLSVFCRTWDTVRPFVPPERREEIAGLILLDFAGMRCPDLHLASLPEWPEVEAACRHWQLGE